MAVCKILDQLEARREAARRGGGRAYTASRDAKRTLTVSALPAETDAAR
jgi:hypothetical protein